MIARRWVPPITWAAVILTLTSIPNPDLGGMNVPGLDKVFHATLYAVLGWLSARAAAAAPSDTDRSRVAAAGSARWVLVLGVILVLAALDEWHQRFVPGRSAELLDWVADGVGAFAGLLAAALARRIGVQYS